MSTESHKILICTACKTTLSKILPWDFLIIIWVGAVRDTWARIGRIKIEGSPIVNHQGQSIESKREGGPLKKIKNI